MAVYIQLLISVHIVIRFSMSSHRNFLLDFISNDIFYNFLLQIIDSLQNIKQLFIEKKKNTRNKNNKNQTHLPIYKCHTFRQTNKNNKKISLGE